MKKVIPEDKGLCEEPLRLAVQFFLTEARRRWQELDCRVAMLLAMTRGRKTSENVAAFIEMRTGRPEGKTSAN